MASFKTELTDDTKYDVDLEDTISDRIQKLTESDSHLTKWDQDDNKEEYDHIMNQLIRIANNIDHKHRSILQHLYPFVWISPNKSIDNVSFEMEYRLTLYHNNDLYYALFTATHQQIHDLHQIALKNKKYFPSHKFPSGTLYNIYAHNIPHRSVSQNIKITSNICYILQCILPSKNATEVNN